MDKKGLISSGASVWPKKMLAAAFIDSAAVVPTLMYSNHPGAIMLGLRHYYHPQILTNFANYKLKSPPIVEHADEETDKVNDGKRTEEDDYQRYQSRKGGRIKCFRRSSQGMIS